MLRKATIAALTVVATAGAGMPLVTASAAESGSISGVAFQDLNRNGVQESGEPGFSGVVLYVFSAGGSYVGQATTDAAGQYRSAALPAGTYRLEYSPTSWWAVQDDWVPTTTGSLRPRQDVAVDGTARADFGWRPIVRSTTAGSPISAYTGPNGLRAESYNDVVTAKELYDAVMRGTVGAEAPRVTVVLDLGASAATTTSVQGSPGSYRDYRSTSMNTWATWLEGDWGVSHEYGHAWSNYHDTIVQQQGGFEGYLGVRGLTGDPRLGTSHAWEPGELIAEDYRQLLGSPEARVVAQENRELPAARNVPGLLEYLRDTFTSAPSSADPVAAPEPVDVSAPVVNPTAVTKTASVAAQVSRTATLSLVIRTSGGALVRTLLAPAVRPAGPFSATWDRKDDQGRRVAAGSYVAVASATADGSSDTAATPFTVR